VSGVLEPGERAALDAVADRLVPADEHGPGAVEMGATVAISRALAGDLRADLPAVRAALLSLGQDFPTSDGTSQDAALTRLQEARPAAFGLLRSLVLEGVFGDPAHGGNVGGAGWQLLGYPGPRAVVTAEDQVIRELG
jgi:gluconate 2-dehydrogenase gamma chain